MTGQSRAVVVAARILLRCDGLRFAAWWTTAAARDIGVGDLADSVAPADDIVPNFAARADQTQIGDCLGSPLRQMPGAIGA